MNDLKSLTDVKIGKKGSIANDFMTKIIARDTTIPEDKKIKPLKAFKYFVDNQKDATDPTSRNKLMNEYKKNINLV